MQILEVSGAVGPIYESLGVKRLIQTLQEVWRSHVIKLFPFNFILFIDVSCLYNEKPNTSRRSAANSTNHLICTPDKEQCFT